MSPKDLKTSKQLTVVTMALGSQTLAIPTQLLREILDPLPVTRVPGAGPFTPGVVNVRGTVVPLVNLRQVLGIPYAGRDDRLRVLVLELEIAGEQAVVAIEADEVHEVSTIETSTIEPVPASASSWPPEFLSGLYLGAQGFIILPNLETIFLNLASQSLAAQS